MWDRKLTDNKGVASNDSERRRGTAKTVVHRNSIKDIYCMKLVYDVVPPLVIYLPSQP